MPQSRSYTVSLRLEGSDIKFIDSLHETSSAHVAIRSFRTWSSAEYHKMRSALNETCLGWESFTLATGPNIALVGKNPSLKLDPSDVLDYLCQDVLDACEKDRRPDFSPHITLRKAEYRDPADCDSFRAEINEYLTEGWGMRRKLEFWCTGIKLWQNKSWHADLIEEFSFNDVSDAEDEDDEEGEGEYSNFVRMSGFEDVDHYETAVTMLESALLCELEELAIDFTAKLLKTTAQKKAKAITLANARADTEMTHATKHVTETIGEEIKRLFAAQLLTLLDTLKSIPAQPTASSSAQKKASSSSTTKKAEQKNTDPKSKPKPKPAQAAKASNPSSRAKPAGNRASGGGAKQGEASSSKGRGRGRQRRRR
ncbi:hypothetical protein DFH08DRAFT_842225 [Mycena albidolilacea]|uniref:Uncharacterized protein n=1 Tax=Mycena albidolilacea TaxID=1033008 RepID=A0AAD7EZ88_9AGAR|nr:hypothetical protein DFH08DRAFT_842225 [Mycena albidolilacea]